MRFTKGRQAPKLKAGEYVRVIDADPSTNLLTVKRANDKTASYDPRRLQGATVYTRRSSAVSQWVTAIEQHQEQAPTQDQSQTQGK